MRSIVMTSIFLLAFFCVFRLEAVAQKASKPVEVWEITLPHQLQIYQASIVPGTTDVVLTSPGRLWRIKDPEGLATVGWFDDLRAGRSLGLSTFIDDAGSRVGILEHDHHVRAGFELFNRNGEPLAAISDAQIFYYRIGPNGRSFVGIDAGGEHIPHHAGRFVYHFFGETGTRITSIESELPQSFDSAYSADGALFALSNQDGLSVYSVNDGTLRWKSKPTARYFALANGSTGIMAVIGEEDRRQLTVFREERRVTEHRFASNLSTVAVSPNGQFVLATDGVSAYLLTLAHENTPRQIVLPGEGYRISSIAISDAGAALIGAQHKDLKNGIIVLSSQNGEIVYRRDMNFGHSSAQNPFVQFDTDGEAALLRSVEELIFIDLP